MPYTNQQVGYQGTDTSQEAADVSEVEALRALVLDSIKERPGTADEVAIRLCRDRLAIRPRCTELRKRGLIQDSKVRRPNDSGKMAIVWEATVIEQPTMTEQKPQGMLFCVEREGSSM